MLSTIQLMHLRDQISVKMSNDVTPCRLVKQTTHTKAADKLGQSLHKLMEEENTESSVCSAPLITKN